MGTWEDLHFYLDILLYSGIFYNKDFPKKLGRNVFSVDSREKAVKWLRGSEVSFSDVNVLWVLGKSLPLGLSVLICTMGASVALIAVWVWWPCRLPISTGTSTGVL